MSWSSPKRRPIAPPRLILGLLAIFCASLDGLSKSGRPAAVPVASDPIFTGLKIDGRIVSGRIVAIDPEQITLASEEGSQDQVPIRSLVKLTRELRTAPQTMEGSHVLFPDGDRLMRVIVGATTDTSIEVQSHSALGKLT